MPSKWNLAAIIAITLTLVIVCLGLQFDTAANAVAVFKTEGLTAGSSSVTVERVLREFGGVSPLRVDASNGFVLAVFDSRSVDPRKVATAVSNAGFPTRINDLLTMQQFQALVSKGAGCGSGGCGDCSKSK